MLIGGTKQAVKVGVEVVDFASISFAFIYVRFANVVDYLISDEGLKKATMVMTLIYIGTRTVYWSIKSWKEWRK